MAEKTSKLKVVGFPPDATADKLTTIFKNKRSQGGGNVENVDFKTENGNMYAIITFTDTEAVDLIMGRGDTVTILGSVAKVEPFYNKVESTQERSKLLLKACEEIKTGNDKPKRTPVSIKPKKPNFSKESEPCSKKKTVSPVNNSVFSQRQAEAEIFPWDLTVKAHLVDLSKNKEFYLLYFEEFREAPFHEESLMLDGVNKVLYVTFHEPEGAQSICHMTHRQKDSNITKVVMARPEDFNTYDNMLFIYGFKILNEEDKDELTELVMNKTQMEVSNVICYGDQAESAIIEFNPETCTDITAATWDCTNLDGEKLITGPVLKEFTILVTGLNPETSDDHLKRYMRNNKRSGGGNIESFSRLDLESAVITFSDESCFQGVLTRDPHLLDDCQLEVAPFFSCLTNQLKLCGSGRQSLPKGLPHQFEENTQPLKAHKDQTEGLGSRIINLYTFYRVAKENGSFKGILNLRNGAHELLKELEHPLQDVAGRFNCIVKIFPNQLHLELDFPKKISARQVKTMLELGLKNVQAYLDEMTVLEFDIPAEDIIRFKTFISRYSEEVTHIYVDCPSNQLIVISTQTPNNLVKTLNELYSDFVSQNKKETRSTGNEEPNENCWANSRYHNVRGNSKSSVAHAPTPAVKTESPCQGPLSQDETVSGTYKFQKDLELEPEELVLLEKCSFLDELEKKYKPFQAVPELDQKKIVLKANEEKIVSDAILDIIKKTKYDFLKINLVDLHPDQIELLKNKDLQNLINSKLNKGHLCLSNHGMFSVHYVKPEAPERLKEIITSEVHVEEKPVDPEALTVLKSSQGLKFLSDLCESIDGTKLSSVIKLDPQSQCIIIVAAKHQQLQLHRRIDEFLSKNKLQTEKIPFSIGKHEFVMKYFPTTIDKIVSLGGSDVEMFYTPETYVIKGLQAAAHLCSGQLKQLSKQIIVDDITLKFLGIQEFLKDREGSSLIKSLEDKHSCIIKFKSDSVKQSNPEAPHKPPVPSKPKNPPTLIARGVLHDVTVCFMQGDITNLTVDAIVNPLESTLEMSSPMSRALVSQGGQEILPNVQSSSADVAVGSVVIRTSAQLSNIKAVFHVVCPVFDENEENEDLNNVVNNCLQQVDQFTSIGFPAVGVGKVFKFPQMAACNSLSRAIIDHITEGTTLTTIYLCDLKSDVLKIMMERFEDISDTTLEKLVDLQDTNARGSAPAQFRSSPHKPFQGGKDFGPIKFNVVLGEINKQKTDIIVITVDKSLDLSKGRLAKTIASEGGPQIQQELSSNYSESLKLGEFAETSGGALPCKQVFHVYLPRHRPGKEYIIKNLVLKLLERADQNSASSIALSALGTGNLGYPPDVAADLITDAVSEFGRKNKKTNLKSVNLVVYPRDQNVAQAFNNVSSKGSKGAENDESQVGGGGGSSQGASYFIRFKSHFQSTKKEHEVTYNKIKVKIKSGDITTEKCDAIVNGIKESMDLSGSGQVCKALLQICGQQLQDECTNKKDEMAQEGVICTAAPNLQCGKILHVSQDKFTRNWDKGVTKVLEEADKLGIKVLALPALGAGTRHPDVQGIKNQILGAIKQFSSTGQHTLSYIKLVIFEKSVLDVFIGQSHKSAHPSKETRDEHEKTKEFSKQVTLKIYGNDIKRIKLATDQLNSECKAAFKEYNFNEDKLKMLDKAQVNKLEKVGRENGILVKVRLDEGLVLMQGFNASAMLPVQNVLSQFIINAVDSHHKSLHNAIVSAIVWQYKKAEKWYKFEAELNSELEKEYKNKSSKHEITDSSNRKYIIDFKAMKETLVDENGRARCTCDIQRIDRTKEGEPLPKKWDTMLETENLKIVPIKSGSQEYKKVEQHVKNRGANIQIKKIERIQNRALYQQYSVKKRDMEKHNPVGHKNELRLFHGTSAPPVKQINENGFNRSYCGTNGTAYGKGVYFHTDSSYSVGYANADTNGNRHMYQARVLVGESTPSNSSMNFLPNKPNSNRPYDSGNSGGIYVIFHDTQVYPEYLITF